jgi:hypothetical protein
MMPTMAGAFFAGAVYRYSKGGQFEQLLYGGFASLMCSGMLRALEGFVQNAGPTSADGYWTAVMNLVNWVSAGADKELCGSRSSLGVPRIGQTRVTAHVLRTESDGLGKRQTGR